jgi:aspartate/glutamate racemase
VPRIALIHALAHSVAPANAAFERDWPEAERMNLLDDSLSADLARDARGLDQAMHDRFLRLGDYATSTGAHAILFTCSAFGPCIEAVARRHADIPVLKPNEAMIEDALRQHRRVGLVASFAPTLRSMPAEFPVGAAPDVELAEGALQALDEGDVDRHDASVVAAALRLRSRGCELIALAQFSMARAASAVGAACDLPVLTTIDSALAAIRRRLNSQAIGQLPKGSPFPTQN